jgi:2-polyprenyl-6-methoxyphenol hydroxylase-like FAD-dependent oxidoreductase
MKNKAIIAGAGIAGPLLAIQLQRNGYAVELFEARDDDPDEGAFLGLTPNGLNVLKNFIPLDALKSNFTLGSMYFFNSKGKEIGALPTDYQKEAYGAETVQVKRSHLYRLIQNKARAEGIAIYFGKKVTQVIEAGAYVQVSFEDGTSARADMLFGCDGAFSAVRRSAFPEAPGPVFTKNIGTGGFAFLPELKNPTKGIYMTFGERGFFAYAVSNTGEVWWFNNYYREKEPTPEEIKTVLRDEISAYLLDLHKNDDPRFSRIIQASHQLAMYPTYDIPKLKQWYTSRICLLGDAAHATSPHIGQGASLAMEDTVCLVNCLVQSNSVTEAFGQFQLKRKARVEKIVQGARKIGNAKSKPSPVAVWFRNRFLRFFLQSEIRKLDWIYGYRAE